MNLGYIKFPKINLLEAHEVNKYNDKEILIVTTGSQGINVLIFIEWLFMNTDI